MAIQNVNKQINMENTNKNGNADTSIKALGEYVLVKQTMVKKKTKIILDASKDEKERFDITFKVLELGSKCTSDVKVGDFPIFTEYVKFNLGRILQKDDNKMVALLLVHEGDIIGIDTNPDFKMQ